MLSENRQINTINLVVLGDFNPAIIQPFWLVSKKLIKEEEANSANLELIHNELVKYQIGDWLNVSVTRERFEVKTSQEPYFDALRDLVLSVFGILKETPIRALGVNHVRHYTLEKKPYYDLGNKIAPLKNWEPLLENPEVLGLEILQKGKPNMPGGQVRIKIQPSDTLKNPYSFMTVVNYHYSITDASLLPKLFDECWRKTFKLSDLTEERIDQIIKS